MEQKRLLTQLDNIRKTGAKQSETGSSATADASHLQRAIDNPSSETLTPEVVASLQSSHGNQFVSRLIQRAEMSGLRIQMASLTVTPADDQYEREADSVAASVVNDINTTDVQRADEDEMMMQRIQRADEDEMMMQRIQRVEDDDPMGGQTVTDDIEQGIESARGSGAPLDSSTQRKMEGAFGADFSGVRVHTDSKSDSLNRSVQAKAFTTGSDIFFRSGTYQPASSGGQELLAHELTHVVQQGGASVQRRDNDDA